MPQAQARRLVDNVLDAIVTAANRGEVALAGFGKFKVKNRSAWQGRNPRTGDTMIIAPARRVSFTPAKQFKDRVNGGIAGKINGR